MGVSLERTNRQRLHIQAFWRAPIRTAIVGLPTWLWQQTFGTILNPILIPALRTSLQGPPETTAQWIFLECAQAISSRKLLECRRLPCHLLNRIVELIESVDAGKPRLSQKLWNGSFTRNCNVMQKAALRTLDRFWLVWVLFLAGRLHPSKIVESAYAVDASTETIALALISPHCVELMDPPLS